MKRSQINRIIEEADAFIRASGVHLPPFAYWSPEIFRARRAEIAEIVETGLGWDITDYGGGDFAGMGLFLFTTRNGRPDAMQTAGKSYAEKVMISRRDQISPMHRHIVKTEDIINRGGATLAIEMFESDGDGHLSRTAPVRVTCDGIAHEFAPGHVLRLAPGASVTLCPGNWHKFWGEGGDVLIGEVSTVNDDRTDNVFADPVGRFAEIEEDAPPRHLLVSDYEAWLG